MINFIRQSRSALILLSAILIVFSFTRKEFFSFDNLVNIGVQTSLLGLMTIGMALTVITGNLDLSVGSIAAFSGIIFAVSDDIPVWLAVVCAVFVGIVLGALNGLLIGKLRFNSIIVTLATMALGEGLALWASRGYPIPGDANDFEMLGGGFFLSVPLAIVWFVISVAVASAFLTQTQFGRDLYAVGSNIELATICDIPVALRLFAVYTLSAALSAFAGVVLASRLNTASPLVGQDAPLQALVAIVIGGMPLSGGEGGMGNIVVGLLIVSVLSNGMNLWNIPPTNRWGITGAMLILFAILDRSRRRSRFAQEAA
jgi:ribose transport system permease protein